MSDIISKQKKSNSLNVTKDEKILWIGIAVSITALGGLGYLYYRKYRKEQLLFSGENDVNKMDTSTSNLIRPNRFRCNSKEYPLTYGTCHDDVEVLQSYLHKIYKEDLGSSGKNNDGVDGMFGNKTNRAAKKHIQKTSFTKDDIKGMKTAIKLIKR